MYNLAIEVGKADTNPCQRVKKFKLELRLYEWVGLVVNNTGKDDHETNTSKATKP